MLRVSNSVSVVLIGDWSKFYIQPDWVAKNVYEQPEIEITVESRGIDFHVSYKKNNIIISPTQEKIIFTATDTSDVTLEYLSKCVNSFVEKATTPQISAYGFNVEYNDADTSLLAEVFDSLSDTDAFIDMGFEITTSKISRMLIKDGKQLKIDSSINGNKTLVHFNEHHDISVSTEVAVSTEILHEFLDNTLQILINLGYDFSGDE